MRRCPWDPSDNKEVDMRELRIRELIDLVVAEVPEAEIRIQKMFEWHFERGKITSQWILGIAASLFISLLIAFFRGELRLVWWQTTLIMLSAPGASTYGIYRLWQLRSINRQFVSTLKLYSEFKRIKTFLIAYRKQVR